MNPLYTLRINVTLGMHKTVKNKVLTYKRYVDFVPMEGMKFKFTNEQDEELEISLINLHYDYSMKEFVEDQEDDTLVDELRENTGPELTIHTVRLTKYIDYYKSFGWEEI